MKLTTNFTRPPLALAPMLVAAFGIVIFAAIVAMLWLIADAGALKRERVELNSRLTQWQTKRAQVSVPTLPSDGELQKMKARVATINRLSNVRGAPIAAILQRFETLLPDSVYLVQLTQRGTEGELQLVAESTDATALTAFLLKLQSDRAFSQALLTRQAQRIVRGQKRIQFELRLKQA